MNELIALQNMANHAGPGIVIHQQQTHDKRRKVPKFFAEFDGAKFSPVLPYEQLNCYLMGYAKAKGQA